MRESSLVPTNLNDWPRVSGTLADLKYILGSLWAAGWLGCHGVGTLPIRGFAAYLGFEPAAVEDGLEILVSRDLILWDKKTGEIFVLDWYRFHKFKSPLSKKMLRQQVEKIQSDKIKDAVIKKSASHLI